MTPFAGQSLPKPGIQLRPTLLAAAIFVSRLEGPSRPRGSPTRSLPAKQVARIGYRGFIALAHRTGKVSSIFPAIVHQGDQFSLKLGTGRQLSHVPLLDVSKRGDWMGGLRRQILRALSARAGTPV